MKTVALPTTREDVIIEKCEIMYCIADSNYTFVYGSKQRWLFSRTLRYIEQLIDEGHFVRIHRKYLVNRTYIKSIDKRKSQIVMHDGQVLEMSRRKKTSALASLALAV